MPTAYHIFQQQILGDSDVTWSAASTTTFKALLLSDSQPYTPDPTTGALSTVFNNATEFSGSGYSRETLSGLSFTGDSSGDLPQLKCDDINFGILDGDTIQGVLVFNADTDTLMFYDETIGPKPTDGSEDITYSPSGNGLIDYE